MFPQFNIHSTPLLILVLQGLIFACLLLLRYRKEKRVADLVIALILLIMSYHRTTYTIGFMGWYDTFKNTKINYFLLSFAFAIGPLIYLYVRTIIVAPFKLKKQDWWHFIPVGLFILYRMVILFHDAQQEDWAVGYDGEWHRDIHLPYVSPVLRLLEYSSQLLYFAFTIQLFIEYRGKIRQYFSNTYKVELNWIRNFLVIYTFLFVYANFTDIVDAFISELDYVHRWWVHFFSAIAIVYLGIKAYFTDLGRLHTLTFDIGQAVTDQPLPPKGDFQREKQKIADHIMAENAFLNPEFTLKDLATGVDMSIHTVSEVINSGFGMNFNEMINQYRVEEVKKRLQDPANDHLSLVSIAFDSGFNSKATFNRVFKQLTGQSPSQFKAQIPT